MEEIKCPKCGAPLPAGSASCQYCGEVLNQPADQAAQTQPQPPVQPPVPPVPPVQQAYVPQQPQQPYGAAPQQGQPYAQPGQQPYPPQGQPYAPQGQPYPPQQPYAPYPQAPGPMVDPSQQKSKMAAGLLGIFLGALGIHNFYLGYTGKAVAQLLISILSCGVLALVSEIWGIVEGVQILTGSIAVDGKGIPLKD